MRLRRIVTVTALAALVVGGVNLPTTAAGAASATVVSDGFGRSVSSGWGSADAGGAWTTKGPSSAMSVSGGSGRITVAKGASAGAQITALSASSSDLVVDLSAQQVATGGGQYFWVTGRGTVHDGYLAAAKISSSGSVNLSVRRTVAGSSTVLNSATLSVATPTSSAPLRLRVSVEGYAPTTIKAKAWTAGQTEPASWQVSAVDSNTSLPATGGVALAGYLSGSSTNGPVTFAFDNLTVSTSVPDALTSGSSKPTAATTGVPDGTTLKVLNVNALPYSADTYFSDGPVVVINTPNAVYDGYQFNAFVEVRAPGVRIVNSLIRGGSTSAERALFRVRNENFGKGIPSAQVTDTSIIPTTPTNKMNGAQGSNFTLKRVEITKTVDGVHINGTTSRTDPNAGNVNIVDSWIHDLIHYNDTSHTDGTHNDGVQIVGGSNISVTGSRIDGTIYNAAFMIAKDRNEIANVNISNNWLAGGRITIIIGDKTYTPVSGMVIKNNVFTRGSTTYTDYAMIASAGTRAIATVSGNTWHDGSTPAPVLRNGS